MLACVEIFKPRVLLLTPRYFVPHAPLLLRVITHKTQRPMLELSRRFYDCHFMKHALIVENVIIIYNRFSRLK